MKIDGRSTRFHERTKIDLPLEVVYHEGVDQIWRERTRTEEVTICGGGFTLSRPVEPQRLVQLRLPMPKQYRLFDHSKEQYEVWGVVRYVRLLELDSPDVIRLKVGAALIGNHPPRTFNEDPTRLYDLKPVLRQQSLWDLREQARVAGRYARSFEDRRSVELSVSLESVSDDGRITERVPAATSNISESGMAVKVTFNGEIPRYVIVKSFNQSLCLLAKVCAVTELTPQTFRLHLHFISGKWFV
jgi:hypothetical protein